MGNKLPLSFYRRTNVQSVAKELLGKMLVTNSDGVLTSGIITETEAYAGVTDKAAHSYGHRRTRRTEVMYKAGGVAYVYLCYGIHHMFNVVSGPVEMPHAILVRAIHPVDGITIILKRRSKSVLSKDLCNGPGKVCQALGIHTGRTGEDLLANGMSIHENGMQIRKQDMLIGPRVGVDYAEEDALLPYRYQIREAIQNNW